MKDRREIKRKKKRERGVKHHVREKHYKKREKKAE